MKIKVKGYLIMGLFALLCITCILSLIFTNKSVSAQIANEETNNKNIETNTCLRESGISTFDLDNKYSCIDYCNSHGPGRENGGVNLLSSGCRNYMEYRFNYGATSIPYWINMESINQITNTAHRQKILSDIREQTKMWNQACMYDGTGQIVNIYEVNTNQEKPSSINGMQVIEVTQRDLTEERAAGLFWPGSCTVELDYDSTNKYIGYNIDTVVHEFGHVLGLNDIDSNNNVSSGTHKTLMGYSRATTAGTLSEAIKYQDVQGIAVTTGRHTCKDSHFMRYIKAGGEYRHICFYCDRIDNRTSIISGSEEIVSNTNCNHNYKEMVSCGDNDWYKCTKCYKVTDKVYKVSFSNDNYIVQDILVGYDSFMPEVDFWAPQKEGYAFIGYFDANGTQYYKMELAVDRWSEHFNSLPYYPCIEKVVPVEGVKWRYKFDNTLYARWKLLECDYTYQNFSDEGIISSTTVHLAHGKNSLTPKEIEGYTFKYFKYNTQQVSSVPAELNIKLYNDHRGIIDEERKNKYPSEDGIYLKYFTSEVKLKYDILVAYYEKTCLADGSMITLADGSQTAVENLTGDEMLLVWNLYTGSYDVAPILFIDSDPARLYKVINLSFSDGTAVKVISEHGFWDYDLNKYVYLDADAEKYIGHWFNKGDGRVQLIGIEIKEEYTSAWSPVTYGHLCYFVNGMLSMPGGIDGLFNIFEVDPETMKYDEALMQSDIEQYGLFTYEEFTGYFEMSEAAFEAIGGKYFKVAIGKGLTTMEQLASLYGRYVGFLG